MLLFAGARGMAWAGLVQPHRERVRVGTAPATPDSLVGDEPLVPRAVRSSQVELPLLRRCQNTCPCRPLVGSWPRESADRDRREAR